MRSTALVVVSLSLLALASCGGGGGGGGGSPLTISIPSQAGLDGWVTVDGFVDTGNTTAVVGDVDRLDPVLMIPVPVGARGFWSFDLSGIPAGATIVSAILSTNQDVVVSSPYVSHGVVTLDSMDYGAALDAGDYGGAPLLNAFATLSADPTVGTKSAVVTAAVQADLVAARTRSQFRAHFSLVDSDNDATPDHADFTTAEAVANRPVLTVTYTP